MKVGIFGGTFDPIHMGHLILAEQAREVAALDQVWFIPAAEPPHKLDKQITAASHRVHMVHLAVRCHPCFHLSTMELEREGPSYTYDTLRVLRESHPGVEFYLLVGADMVKDLPNWYKIKEILQFVQVIGLGRPGVEVETLPAEVKNSLHWIPDAIETNISSTEIRQRLRQGKSVRYLVPDSVYQYMREHGLYGS
ncbi:nicotinate-nucleotide adenylyltransferase [Laceyella putida]|uniref:Probable nicotinate-nucleotide adenylyltransferase n=1 Tax=Laceyella putida TaxID=110101 RepID=A0ABW2RI94_9BACL